MKKNYTFSLIFYIVPLFLLVPGCVNRVTQWSKETFNQGHKIDLSIKQACGYARTIHVYDEFATLGIFDVLWLSDDVRRAYAALHAVKSGTSQEAFTALQRRQRALNDHSISFYILGYQPAEPKVKLFGTDKHEGKWSVYLEIDGKLYRSATIKCIEYLEPEYIMFFDKRYNRHQGRYLVTFDAQDAQGNNIITPQTRTIMLYLSTGEKKVALNWYLDKTVPVLPSVVKLEQK